MKGERCFGRAKHQGGDHREGKGKKKKEKTVEKEDEREEEER